MFAVVAAMEEAEEANVVAAGVEVAEKEEVVGAVHGGPNDSGIDSLRTGPLTRPFARSLAPLTHSLAPDCSLRSRPPLRSLVRSLA